MNKILSYAFLALFPLLASCSNVPQELPVVAEEALPKPVEGAVVLLGSEVVLYWV